MNVTLRGNLRRLAALDESRQLFGAECRLPSDSMVINQYPYLLPEPQGRTFYRMEYALCVRGREAYDADVAAIQQRINTISHEGEHDDDEQRTRDARAHR